MSRSLALAAVTLALALSPAALPSVAGGAAREVTLSGEIVDLGCYMVHPATATGAGHKECATKCLAKGMPAGLLTPKGELYLLLMDHDKATVYGRIKDLAAETVSVTGRVVKSHGMTGLVVASVREPAPAPAK